MWDAEASEYAPKFDILITSLSVPRNYFYRPTELFSDLYLSFVAKFLNISVKSFFPCGTGSKKRRARKSLIFSVYL